MSSTLLVAAAIAIYQLCEPILHGLHAFVAYLDARFFTIFTILWNVSLEAYR